jgi:hypothetical protein
VGRLPWLKDEDNLCNFPFGREVVEKQDGVESLNEVFSTDYGQFFENFNGDKIVAWSSFGLR